MKLPYFGLDRLAIWRSLRRRPGGVRVTIEAEGLDRVDEKLEGLEDRVREQVRRALRRRGYAVKHGDGTPFDAQRFLDAQAAAKAAFGTIIHVDRKAIARNRVALADGMETEAVFVIHDSDGPVRRGKRVLVLSEPPVVFRYDPEHARFHAVAWVETEAEVQVE